MFTAEMVIKVLGCIEMKQEKPGDPPYQLAFESHEKKRFGEVELPEVVVRKFKSLVSVPPGTVRVRVSIGAYFDDASKKAALYGRVLEVISSQANSSPGESKKG